ncbi:MAG: FkbM family methyltransferase [Turicibacter sp.]|nr:FkbM family methyltransferase [Turicibacter sp.]
MKQLLKRIRSRFHNDILAELSTMQDQQNSLLHELKNPPDSTALYNINKVYKALADEISRNLFWGRLQMNITGDINYFFDSLLKMPLNILKSENDRNTDNCLVFLQNYNGNHKGKFIIFAERQHNGRIKWYYELFKKYNIEPYGIYSPKTDFLPQIPLPLINEKEFQNAMKDSTIFLIERSHLPQTQALYNKFPNATFIQCYTRIGTQYFDKDIIQPIQNEVFVDAGAYGLKNSRRFVEWTSGEYSDIHAFEPDKKNYKNCLKILKNPQNNFDSQKIKLVQKGLYDKSATISFNMNKRKSTISDDGILTIKTIALDKYMKNQENPPTFIKMDVEGAELAALKGAKETIKRHRPRLAICIYHKPEDILDIPLYILSLVPDYKLYIRHYTTWKIETVLYCI